MKHKFIESGIRRAIQICRQIHYYPISRQAYVQILQDIAQLEALVPTIWYFCAPIHPNLGDLAQRYCIENWIAENYPSFQVVTLPTKGILFFKRAVVKKLHANVRHTDRFLFQSGYTMADYHPDDRVRRLVLSHFPNTPCLILPQTILYTVLGKYNRMKRLFDTTTAVYLLARDATSFDYAERLFPNLKIARYPDIVTTLIGKYRFNNDRSGICLCLRNDGEKYYTRAQIAQLVERLKPLGRVDVTDTKCDGGCASSHEAIEEAVGRKIDTFSRYQAVITDRYHGTIFSLVAGTPVIVIKTTDHKLSSGVDWFKDRYGNYVYYCADIESAFETARTLLAGSFDHALEPFFQREYYDKLKSEWENV